MTNNSWHLIDTLQPHPVSQCLLLGLGELAGSQTFEGNHMLSCYRCPTYIEGPV